MNNTFNKEKEMIEIKDKDILYVPIISSINRDTNLYRLDVDGNVVRFVTFFSHHNDFRSLTILLPEANDGHYEIINNFVKNNPNVNIVWKDCFGKHAGEQRRDNDVIDMLNIYITFNAYRFDKIFFESQGLGMKLIDNYKPEKLVYWCPVCKIDDQHTRDFLEGYDDKNLKLFKYCGTTIFCAPMQVEKYKYSCKHIYYYSIMIDLSLGYFYGDNNFNSLDNFMSSSVINYINSENKTCYYLPYRLTDMGYKVDDVIDFINKSTEMDRKVDVFYTDPNNSHYFDDKKNINKFKENIFLTKISSSRFMHLSMLSNDLVIVPYFEDLDFINHAILWEMMYFKSKCKFVVSKEQYEANPYNIRSCDRCYYTDIDRVIAKMMKWD